jgi:hypothetical protein
MIQTWLVKDDFDPTLTSGADVGYESYGGGVDFSWNPIQKSILR